MSIHSGTISVLEVGRIYNVGFAYAKNIVDKLEEIGYVKKSSSFEYSMIQTEQAIDAYIKEHFEEFRPNYYNALELKDNGKPTLKSKAKKAWKSAPMFMCRLFLSPFSVFLFIISPSFATFIFGTMCNMGYGIYVSKRKNIKFTEFMLRPWINIRVRTISEIRGIMRKSNIKFKSSDYYETLRRLKIHLSAKKKLAEHYADMANNAENENEFYQSINSCLEVLEWMSQFEKYGVYEILEEPSEDIRKIKEGMPISVECFKNRMKASGQIALEYDDMEGHDFEYYCADILRKNGFENVEVTRGSGDHGIDILAEKDNISYAIQCKCYSSNIGNAAVQQAHTGKSIYKKDIAVVLTNRYFTPQAKEEAAALGVKLWDRDKLNKLCSIIQNESNINVIYHKEKAKKSIPADVINLSEEDSRIIFEFLKSKSLHYIESYLKIKESNNYQNEEKINVEPPIVLYNAKIHFKLNTIKYVFYSKVNPKFYKTSAYVNVFGSKNVDIFQIDVFYNLDSVSYDRGNIIISSEPEVAVLGAEFKTMELLEEIYDWKTEEDYLTEQSFYLKKSNYKSI